jgi:hypothetical protein
VCSIDVFINYDVKYFVWFHSAFVIDFIVYFRLFVDIESLQCVHQLSFGGSVYNVCNLNPLDYSHVHDISAYNTYEDTLYRDTQLLHR